MIVRLGGTACVYVVALLPLMAQSPQRPIFRAGSTVVRIDVLAIDHGRPIAGLTPQDFVVKDDGVEQQVDLATTANRVTVAIALDVSQSVEDHALAELVGACRALADALRPDDRAWFVSFSDHFDLRAGPVRGADPVREALEKLRSGGGTSLWDAIFSSVSLVTGMDGRSLVLVFSDGKDTTSWLGENRAIETLKRSEVVVDAVQPRQVIVEPVPLERAARTTGGVVIEAARSGGLAAQFVSLLDEFRLGYVLTYTPTHVKSGDGWHSLSVKLRHHSGTTRTREGYVSSRASSH